MNVPIANNVKNITNALKLSFHSATNAMMPMSSVDTVRRFTGAMMFIFLMCNAI